MYVYVYVCMYISFGGKLPTHISLEIFMKSLKQKISNKMRVMAFLDETNDMYVRMYLCAVDFIIKIR